MQSSFVVKQWWGKCCHDVASLCGYKNLLYVHETELNIHHFDEDEARHWLMISEAKNCVKKGNGWLVNHMIVQISIFYLSCLSFI